jgi:hypothetical protein
MSEVAKRKERIDRNQRKTKWQQTKKAKKNEVTQDIEKKSEKK